MIVTTHTRPPKANTTINKYFCLFGTRSLRTTGSGSNATAMSVTTPNAELKNQTGNLGRQRPGGMRSQKKSTGRHRNIVRSMAMVEYARTTAATAQAASLKVRILPKTLMHCETCSLLELDGQASSYRPRTYDRKLRQT